MTSLLHPGERDDLARPSGEETLPDEHGAAGPAAQLPDPDGSSPAEASVAAGEPRLARLGRHVRRARLYATAGFFVAVVAMLVVLASENTETAKLDWLFGSTNASLAWIIVAAAVFGWLLGITTALVVRHRTRRVQ